MSGRAVKGPLGYKLRGPLGRAVRGAYCPCELCAGGNGPCHWLVSVQVEFCECVPFEHYGSASGSDSVLAVVDHHPPPYCNWRCYQDLGFSVTIVMHLVGCGEVASWVLPVTDLRLQIVPGDGELPMADLQWYQWTADGLNVARLFWGRAEVPDAYCRQEIIVPNLLTCYDEPWFAQGGSATLIPML
jgi:hypothetical protein